MSKLFMGYMSKEFNKMLGEYKIAAADPEALRTRQKTFEWSFGAAGFVIGAVIGAALVATGVLAPLGVGIWATMAIIAVTSGVIAAPFGRSVGLAVAKSTEPVRNAANDDQITESYQSMIAPLSNLSSVKSTTSPRDQLQNPQSLMKHHQSC